MKYFLKNLGVLSIVPIIVIDVVVPVLIVLSFLYADDFAKNCLLITQYFFPLFSVWLSVFIIREFVETDGCEVYFAAGKVNILLETFKIFAISTANIIILMIGCSILDYDVGIEIVRIVSACIFCFGLIYFISMCFRVISAAIFAAIIYILINIILRSHIIRFPFFMSTNLIAPDDIYSLCIPLCLCSIVLICLGKIFENKNKII